MNNERRTVRLVLEDGTELSGVSFGAQCACAGEVVFNTGMAGYVEALTDASYRGQILVLTYPLVGNYGVPAPREAGSIERPYESDRIQVQGLVVQDYVDDYSHGTATRSLGEWLGGEGIPAITGIDTRFLTRHLREKGTMQGSLIIDDSDVQPTNTPPASVDMQNVFDLVAPEEPTHYEGGELKILVVDIGAKDNIVRSLLARNTSVIRQSWNSDLISAAQECDGVMLSNGPGDPKDLAPLIEQIRTLMQSYEKPIFGVCLGHQIMALAAGADTYKLKYGHRGVNQPVQELLSRRCYVTSQNHGYAVKDDSLPADWESWFININDGTNEGIRSITKPFFSVQFHPEASPGPQDTGYLFDEFLRLVGAMRHR